MNLPKSCPNCDMRYFEWRESVKDGIYSCNYCGLLITVKNGEASIKTEEEDLKEFKSFWAAIHKPESFGKRFTFHSTRKNKELKFEMNSRDNGAGSGNYKYSGDGGDIVGNLKSKTEVEAIYEAFITKSGSRITFIEQWDNFGTRDIAYRPFDTIEIEPHSSKLRTK